MSTSEVWKEHQQIIDALRDRDEPGGPPDIRGRCIVGEVSDEFEERVPDDDGSRSSTAGH